jgi:undecaprenyl-diphosphatase
MDLFQAFVLAVVQGLTEFLPISSAAHLILVPHLVGWEDQGLAFDLAVHLGSLVAVVVYFREEVRRMFWAWLASLAGGESTADGRLAWMVILATIPAGLAGLLLYGLVSGALRSPLVIAGTTIGFALLMWWADRRGGRFRDELAIGWREALFIGVAQAIALIPGTSRSGITITAGLMLGLTREAAARFSFLMAIPVIALASGFDLIRLARSDGAVDFFVLGFAVAVSAVTAWLAIHWFLRLLARFSLIGFVIYRLLLGLFLLYFFGLRGAG